VRGCWMINYVSFYTRIWTDKKFRKLSALGKLLFIYLFTNHEIGLTGIYELDIEDCEMKLKIGSKFDEVFSEIENLKMVRYDKVGEVVFVVNRFKLIPNKSAKVIQGAINELNLIQHRFKNDFISEYKEHLMPYLANLKNHKTKTADLLNEQQVLAFARLGWQRDRLFKFYKDRDYKHGDVALVVDSVLSSLNKGEGNV